jgi:hypothetical protein
MSAPASHRFRHTEKEARLVLLCWEYLYARDTPCHDVVDSAGCIKACTTGHTPSYLEGIDASRISSL